MWAKFVAWLKSIFTSSAPLPTPPAPAPVQAGSPDSAAFDKAFAYTVGNEGGYTNDAADSGGPTNFGITQGDLSQWLGHSASVQEVKDMSLDTAKAIYKKHYWDAMLCGSINDTGVAMCMFDIGVVRGIGVPPKYAQTICNNAVGGLVIDGKMGPKTLAAINSVAPKTFIADFAAMAADGFRTIASKNPTQTVFLKGWLNRAARLLTLIKN